MGESEEEWEEREEVRRVGLRGQGNEVDAEKRAALR